MEIILWQPWSYTTHFTVDIPDDDTHTITGGSTTATDSITITHYFDRRYSITNTTLTEVWNDTMLGDFDFLWIESDQAVEIQLMCNEGGTVAGSNLENAWVVKLAAGIPFVLLTIQVVTEAMLQEALVKQTILLRTILGKQIGPQIQ